MWTRLDNHTEALLVPGGMVLQTFGACYGEEGSVPVAMVFVPQSVGDCWRPMEEFQAWIAEKAKEREAALSK